MSSTHQVVITQPDPESDDFEFAVTCPSINCSLWMRCKDCSHEPTEQETAASEYFAHDVDHSLIDGEWMTDTEQCAANATESGADGLSDLAHQFGPSTQQFDVDYWGDGVWDIIHVPSEVEK
ncbi:hypothetical protein MB46_10315 [Arthrobacter alpinus]|uniref:hypothetical protein n=1 Tax=Arthrobacter alpinus TaxID=656366 RepID=UPI0005C8480F|nr:hypothetical protein [Arthrobacter alpinus]ALV45814.1 hypothetical protein MB46_10315 [Arthrobacter alpinus]